MDSLPLIIYAIREDAPPLRGLLDALRKENFPAGFSVGIAGEATDAELDATDWDAAMLRWNEPEMHEIALLERLIPGEDEEADAALQAGQQEAETLPMSGGRFLALDHLRQTRTLYAWDLQPALLAEDEHPGWAALDIALRTLAETTDGLIYAEAEGFYDMDGEPMVAETMFEDDEADEAEETEEAEA